MKYKFLRKILVKKPEMKWNPRNATESEQILKAERNEHHHENHHENFLDIPYHERIKIHNNLITYHDNIVSTFKKSNF